MFLQKEFESLLMKASNNVSTSRIAVPEAISSMYHQVHRLEVQLQVCQTLQRLSENPST